MDRTAPQQAERAAVCDLFVHVGPDAPTLCAGWATYDLAAHLVIRERKPLSGPGLVMGGAAARLTARMLTRAKQTHSYAELVALVRAGPPAVLRPFDKAMNLTEYFVHHEDVRRGGGDTTARTGAEAVTIEDALWTTLHRRAKFMTRAVKTTGIDLIRPDGEVIHARPGTPVATLTGNAAEIVLFLSGRGDAAHVELGGPGEAVAAVRAAGFGI
ncbi:MAG TPA: TIGR03085 family metal-binding protein [Acidimicrobiales bacterium]